MLAAEEDDEELFPLSDKQADLTEKLNDELSVLIDRARYYGENAPTLPVFERLQSFTQQMINEQERFF